MISYILSATAAVSVIAVFAAIFVDFVLYGQNNLIKKSKRSIVATGSMTCFYVVYYLILRFRLGCIVFSSMPIVIFGTAMIVMGAVVNLLGRLQLKGNWANHIKIYRGHTLVNHGVYGIVRHPLYASIMLMLFGGSLAYRNWLSAALTLFVFIPFMYYRAKQEESLLEEEFAEYEEYRNKTGMFFPRIWR